MLIGRVSKSILLVGKKDCEQCNRQKDYFERKELPYVYQDMSELSKPFKLSIFNLRKTQGIDEITLPLQFINNEVVSGFQPVLYDEILKIN